MKIQRTLILFCAVALCIGGANAQNPNGEPVRNVSPELHGNLAAAQDLIQQAYNRLSDAQIDNDSELGGHAARAKELLREAAEEVKQAAIAANNR